MTNPKPRQRGRPFTATPARKISVTVSWVNWKRLEPYPNRSETINFTE